MDDAYSLYILENIEKAKIDSAYLGLLLEHNKNLIWHIIHKYVQISPSSLSACGMTYDDIYQVGCIGFMKAIRAFDTQRGNKFSSLAAITIAREVRHFMRSNFSVINISRGAQQLLTEIKDIESVTGYLPPVSTLAELLNVSEKRINQVLRVGNFVKSLEDTNSYDMGYSEYVESDDRVDLSVEDKLYVDRLIDTVKDKLSDVEMKVLKLQLSGNNQSDTAKDLGVSNMRVSRIVQKIREILKDTEFRKGEYEE